MIDRTARPARGIGTAKDRGQRWHRPCSAVIALIASFALAACSGATRGTADASSPETPAPSSAQEGARAVQPGAPGEGSRALDAETRSLFPRLAYTEADVRFMQNMIHHHAQALDLSRLVPDRTTRADIRLLADRIDRSQIDEIALMERWLLDRGEEVPEWRSGLEHGDRTGDDRTGHSEHAVHHDHEPPAGAHDDHPLMAGMLTPEQMATLASLHGEAFDRRFLEYMIYHHQGAIEMVQELFSMPGAGQDSEIFQFASHVGSDQRIEIARMERMLRDGG